MSDNRQHIEYLWQRFSSKQASSEELDKLFDYLQQEENEAVSQSFLEQYFAQPVSGEPVNREYWLKKLKDITNEDRSYPGVHRVHFLKTSWFRYAAAVIVLLGGAAIYWLNNRNASDLSSSPQVGISAGDIAPGTNRAILTVGNKNIDLATNKTGIAVNNVISYNDGEKIADAGQLLQLTTPKGGQYQAVLPDGSKVWLNAASSIQFPSKFTGNTRDVEISGEVYIEVAKNSKQPFYVHTGKTDIQVLGTSFNINAYQGEQAERTTLIGGSIRIISNEAKRSEIGSANTDTKINRKDVRKSPAGVLLQPGQQALVAEGGLKVLSADIEQTLAWKNGVFQFKEATIQEVMLQLSRWYDIEIIYKDQLKPQHFNGGISRNVEFSKVIKMLEATGVFHFRIEGKKVYVIP